MKIRGEEIDYYRDESMIEPDAPFFAVYVEEVPDMIQDAYWGEEELRVEHNGTEVYLEVVSMIHDRGQFSQFILE